MKKKKILVKPMKSVVYDWNDIVDKFEELCLKKYDRKRDYRNWANKQFTGKPDDPPYRDFWHKICDEVHNGSISYYHFGEMADDWRNNGTPEEQWCAEICDVFNEVCGDQLVEVYHSW